MSEVVLHNIVNGLAGWCTEIKATRLYKLIKDTDSKLTIELGVFGGRSFIPMAIAHKEKGSGFVIGIDAWKASVATEGTNSPENDKYWRETVNYKYIYDQCQLAIYSNGLEDFCDTLRMKSQTAGLLMADNIVDVIHQDSGHNTEVITAELEIWIPKLKVGGYWVADDCDWRESQDGYAKLPSFGLELVEDHVKWQIWIKRK